MLQRKMFLVHETHVTRQKIHFSDSRLATCERDERQPSLMSVGSSDHHRPMSSYTRHRSRTFPSLIPHARQAISRSFETRILPSHASIRRHPSHTRSMPPCSRVRRDPRTHDISALVPSYACTHHDPSRSPNRSRKNRSPLDHSWIPHNC